MYIFNYKRVKSFFLIKIKLILQIKLQISFSVTALTLKQFKTKRIFATLLEKEICKQIKYNNFIF